MQISKSSASAVTSISSKSIALSQGFKYTSPFIRICQVIIVCVCVCVCVFLHVYLSASRTIILFLLTFYFVLTCSQLTNNVIVAGEQHRDSAIHIHVPILPQTPLPFRPSHIEQSSIRYTVGPCWLPIPNRAVCTCPRIHSFLRFFSHIGQNRALSRVPCALQ